MASREAQAAARWWAEHLEGRPAPDSGDGLNDAFMLMEQRQFPPPTGEQVERFLAALEMLIDTRIVGSDSWRNAIDKGEPQRGSAFRVVGVDYDPDPILLDALAAADIKPHTGVLPIKTVMWINPGEVNVAHGYGHPIEPIYEAAPR